jgi:hypothetical protein
MNLGHSVSESLDIASRMRELMSCKELAHSAWSADSNLLTSISKNVGYLPMAGLRALNPKLPGLDDRRGEVVG